MKPTRGKILHLDSRKVAREMKEDGSIECTAPWL
jgi:hypothetical protein